MPVNTTSQTERVCLLSLKYETAIKERDLALEEAHNAFERAAELNRLVEERRTEMLEAMSALRLGRLQEEIEDTNGLKDEL